MGLRASEHRQRHRKRNWRGPTSRHSPEELPVIVAPLSDTSVQRRLVEVGPPGRRGVLGQHHKRERKEAPIQKLQEETPKGPKNRRHRKSRERSEVVRNRIGSMIIHRNVAMYVKNYGGAVQPGVTPRNCTAGLQLTLHANEVSWCSVVGSSYRGDGPKTVPTDVVIVDVVHS